MKWTATLKGRNYFYHLLITISTFFTVAVFSLSLFLYTHFNSLGIDIINKSNQKLLSQIAYNVEYTNQYAKDYSSALYSNPNVAMLMHNNEIDIYDSLKNVNTLQTFVRSTPFVHSVYVYNGTLNRYYVVGSESNIIEGNFYDRDIQSIFRDITQMGSASPIARRIPASSSSAAPADVYTYILSDTYANNATKNGIVVNININWIFNTLITAAPSQEAQAQDSSIFLLNAEGQVLGHSNSGRFLDSLSSETYVRSILQQNRSSGYFVDHIQGEKSIVTYSSIRSPEWKIASIIPYQNVAKAINQVKLITILISFLILAAGIVMAYVLSRVLYSPVGLLRNKIDHLLGKGDIHRGPVNEFQYIESSLSRTAELLKTLQQYKLDTTNLLKQEYMQNLLLGKPDSKAKFNEARIRLSETGNIHVIVLKIDHYRQFLDSRSDEENALLRFALTNISDEIFSESFFCESFNPQSDHTVSILQARDSRLQEEAVLQEIKRLAVLIQDTYRNYFKVSISFFTSEAEEGLGRIHEAYTATLQLSLHRIRFGHGCILVMEDAAAKETGKFDLFGSPISGLLEAIKGGKTDSMWASFAPIADKLLQCDYNSIMFTLSHIASSVFNTLNIMEQNGIVKFGIDFLSFHGTITKLETLEEIGLEFQNLFQYISDQLQSSKDHRHVHIVENAILYINKNMADNNLSQNAVADVLKLSPVTLGKVFRETTGLPMTDYIKNLRLEKAKELLRQTNLSIDEIVEEIGWGNKKYFSTVFKQQYGVTPMEYRLKSSMDRI
ncbi:MAG: hypothetical protein K0R57_29 [Paenibacillaceae bacterium]|jgi:AraC-like DNA-binding protein|nr:hypothetical protein [Paenibacillaceae bacterium]